MFKLYLEFCNFDTWNKDEKVREAYAYYIKTGEINMITEERLEKALKFLSETDEESASASANVKYLDRLLKRKKALFITSDKNLKSISAKEQGFYASDIYEKAIDEQFNAEVKASTLENKRDKEILVIDLFRTLEASRRKGNI